MPEERRTIFGGDCLEPEAIAAYVDRKLPAAQRAEVEAHTAACGACYALLTEVIRTSDDMDAAATETAATGASAAIATPRETGETATLLRPAFGRRRMMAIAGGVLATAAAVLLVVRFGSGGRPVAPELEDIVAAVGTHRTIEARVTGGFAYGPLMTPSRSGGDSPQRNLSLLAAAGALQQKAASAPEPGTLHALGVAQLLLERYDEAIATIERVTQLEARNARFANDLAAAYIARAEATGRVEDLPRALELTEAALAAEPANLEAAFNRALVLEKLNLRPVAREAWQKYLTLDSRSPWADEARVRLQRLESPAPVSDGRARPLSGGCLAALEADYAAGRVAGLEAAAESCGRAATDAHDRRHAAFYSAVGAYYAGRPSLAEERARALLEDPDVERDMALSGRALYVLGALRFVHADFETALQLERRAVAALESAGDLEAAGSARQTLAEILRAVGENDAAWREYFAALRTLPGIRSHIRRHALLNSVGIASFTQGYPHLALHVYASAIENAKGSAASAQLAEIHVNRARARLAVFDSAGAERDIESARRLLDSVHDPELASRLRIELDAAEAQVLTKTAPGRAAALARDAAAGYRARGLSFRQAFVRLIAARASAAAGDLQTARRELLDGIELIETEQAALEQRRLRISHLDRVWDLYRQYADLTIGERDYETGFVFIERAKAAQHRLPYASLAVSSMASAVTPGTRIVVYAFVPSGLARWTLDSRGLLFHHEKVGEEIVAELSTRLTDHLGRNSGEQERAPIAAALSNVLLRALPSGPDVDRLVIVPDGPIARVAFSALRWPQTQRRLIDDSSIALAPSVLLHLRSEQAIAASRPAKVTVIADPLNSAAALSRLPNAALEGHAVAREYGAADLYTGSSATVEALLEGLGSSAVVHFAGHAIADASQPFDSRLIVAPSPAAPRGVWRPAASSAAVRATVVLAACSTAVGKPMRGEGLVSLASALLAAGAPGVVATLWDINDRDARGFFVSLHRALAQGKRPSEAVRQAQLAPGAAPPIAAAVIALGS